MHAIMEQRKPGSASTLPAWPTLDWRIDVSKSLTVEDRFWAKVDKTDTCWLWTGARLVTGYGQFPYSRGRLAHRFAYEHFMGLIPDGLTIDHLCRNTSCVNPAHLEPVTIQVNLARGTSGPAVNARKTHCIRGHELAGANLMMNGKYRQCRTCRNEAQNRRYRERMSTA